MNKESEPLAPTTNSVNKPSWARRFRVIVSALIFLGSLISYIIICKELTPMMTQVLMALISAFLALIIAYIGGAVWDDKGR